MLFEYNQIPLFFSETTRTLYLTERRRRQARSGLDDGSERHPERHDHDRRGAPAWRKPFDLRLKRSITDVRAASIA